MGLPKAKVDVKCEMCGLSIHPLVSRYLWLGAGWRGRPSPKPQRTDGITLCGPCADDFLHREAPFLTQALFPRGKTE